MTVGVLLVAHGDMGQELIRVARSLLGELPLPAAAVSMPNDCDDGAAMSRARALIDQLDSGAGVLVMTDLYGATPSNLGQRVARLGTPVRRVSALSLPMLLRVMNYADLPLDELPAIAAAGARNGAIIDEA